MTAQGPTAGRPPGRENPPSARTYPGRDDGLPRGYLRACLLLLVAEAPVHGYELVARVRDLGVGKPDAASVYRTLRSLENEGLVSSWWASSVAGPARRVYQTTVPGRDCLAYLACAVEDSHLHLSDFLHRHRALERQGAGRATQRLPVAAVPR